MPLVLNPVLLFDLAATLNYVIILHQGIFATNATLNRAPLPTDDCVIFFYKVKCVLTADLFLLRADFAEVLARAE